MIKKDDSRDAHIALVTEMFAECVVKAAPQPARQLVLSNAGTINETQAFSEIMPFLNDCLQNGSQITFSKVALKATIAEGLYRLAFAADPAPEAK